MTKLVVWIIIGVVAFMILGPEILQWIGHAFVLIGNICLWIYRNLNWLEKVVNL